MKRISLASASRVPVAIFVLGLLYVVWLVVGLRFEASDDAVLALVENVSRHHHFGVASEFAKGMGRIIFYPKIMIAMWCYRLYNSIWYDFVNDSLFVILWVTVFYFISIYIDIRNAIMLTGFCLFMFPLHFYYTVPQGYGPNEYYCLIALFASVSLLAGHLRAASRPRLIGSLVLFGVSLSGSEFIFALGPSLLILTVLFFYGATRRSVIALAPYFGVLVIFTAAYIAYSASHTVSGHTAPRFDPSAIAQTFAGLEVKSFVPLGLLSGILLLTPLGQGLPGAPKLIDYQSLFGTSSDYLALLVIFVAGAAAFGYGLFSQHMSSRSRKFCLVAALLIAVVPTGLVSISAVYQAMVPPGYVQGHISSFPSQLGLAAAVWVICAWLVDLTRGRARIACALIGAMILSALVTTIFLYNNLNRQSMNASMQRWTAFTALTDYIYDQRSDLLTKTFYMPEFSQTYAVTAAPGPLPPYYTNYWESFSQATLKKPIHAVAPGSADVDGSVYASYFAVPSGQPVVVILEQPRDGHSGELTAISPVPLAGELLHGASSELKGWTCDTVCVLHWPEDQKVEVKNLVLKLDDKGTGSLLGQFILSREGAFGQLASVNP